LLVVVPIAVTILVIYKIITWIDNLLPFQIPVKLPGIGEVSIPGLGILTIVVAVTAFGYLAKFFVANPFFVLLERMLERTPLLKIIYTSVKDLIEAFVGEKKRFNQPVLVEEFLPGREFTVGVIGTGEDAYIPGAMEIIYLKNTNQIYSYDNKENYEGRIEYQAVSGQMLEDCKDVALNAWKALNCLDGGRVDVKIDRFGRMSFIEVNPLAGLNPVTSDLPILCGLNGKSFQELMNEILASAIKRNFN